MHYDSNHVDIPMNKTLSIVMQGAVLDKNQSLSSAIVDNIITTRLQYPEAEFIVSTWEIDDENKNRLDQLADEYSLVIIYNKDPGVISSIDRVVSSNINRMIVSTRNGIKASTRQSVLKIRTDSRLYDNRLGHILSYVFESRINRCREENYKIFDNYVINCNLFARDARGYLPYLFHPGDICLAGKKDDLLLLFDIPLANDSIFSNISRACFLSVMKYVPEQYMWVHCINKRTGNIVYLGNDHYNNKCIELSERYYINNFVALAPSQIGFDWPKHKFVYKSKGVYSVYSINDWKCLYNHYNRNYFSIYRKEVYVKVFVTSFVSIYFFVRTCILKITPLRNFAIKYFRKRG